MRDKRLAVDAGYDVIRLLFKTPGSFEDKVPALTARTARFGRLVDRLAGYRVADLAAGHQRAHIARVGARSAARLGEHLAAAARGDRSAEERLKRFIRRTFRRFLNGASFAPQPLQATPRPGKPMARGALSGRLIFTGSRDGNVDVYAMNADGTGVANLSRNGRFGPDAGVRGGPAFSEDGASIAFVSARDNRRTDDGELTTEIYVMDADGTRQRRLTQNALEDGDPTWSPDGARIAFVRRSAMSFDIHVMNADGSEERPLAATGGLEFGPAWSPDGLRIAFARVTLAGEAVRTAIVVVDVSTGAETVLTDGPGFDTDPAWSPDGRRLVFTSTRDGFGLTCFHDCSPSQEIYVMDADGANPVRLTQSLAQDIEPAFSPDGALVVWSSDRDDPTRNYEIYAMNADGTCPRRLTDDPDWDRTPAWLPSHAPTGAPLRC